LKIEDIEFKKKITIVDFEVKRQIKVLENSGSVENETRSFDTESG
jgi:Asp-tRNA(Asn)/Glu-tRNA(Gln) amidotransferase B subunit